VNRHAVHAVWLLALGFVLIAGGGCGDPAGGGSDTASYRFCAGVALRYPQALELAIAEGTGADPGRSRGSRRWLRAVFTDEFVAGARAGDRELARTVRRGAEDAQDGVLSSSDLARYRRAHRDLVARSRDRCPP